jgi:hypothetical protein
MRERDFLRSLHERDRLQKLDASRRRDAEKEVRYSLFRLARMLAIHQIIEALFGGKK